MALADQLKENLFRFPGAGIRFSVLAKPLPLVLAERHLLFHSVASATFVFFAAQMRLPFHDDQKITILYHFLHQNFKMCFNRFNEQI